MNKEGSVNEAPGLLGVEGRQAGWNWEGED